MFAYFLNMIFGLGSLVGIPIILSSAFTAPSDPMILLMVFATIISVIAFAIFGGLLGNYLDNRINDS